MVEVELDLVGRGTDRLVAGELQLLDKILMRVLSHASALISVEEDIVDVERGSNQGLVVSISNLLAISVSSGGSCVANGDTLVSVLTLEAVDGPEALVDGTDVNVNLDLVILEGDQGKSKAGVTAVPELQRHVEGGLRQSIAGSANLAGSGRITRTINVVEVGVSDVCQLSGVANHLAVAALLLGRHGKLVPDVHPVTILAIDALATNLNLDLGNHLLAGEIQPAGIDTVVCGAVSGGVELLVNLRKSNLEIRAVGKIAVSGDRASHTAAEIGLAVESLFNRLHGKVSMAAVGHLPESNLGVSSQVHVLCAVSDELHQASSHFIILLKKKNL